MGGTSPGMENDIPGNQEEQSFTRAGTGHTPETPPLRVRAGREGIASLPNLHMGGFIQLAASLLWLPQAAFIAMSIQRLMDGGGLADVTGPAVAVLALGFFRSMIDMTGSRVVFRTARKNISLLRNHAIGALASRSPLDTGRPTSGMAASVIAEQTEAILPYLTKYRPVQTRVVVVPLVILGSVVSLSWVAALILLVSAPLIPLFMALIGWRAKDASAAQMIEIGTMNEFLLDRLRGLTSIRSLGAVEITALRFRATADALRKRTMAVLRIAFLSSAVLELFSALGVAMVAVYVGFHLLGQLPFGAWGAHLSLGEGLFILLLAPAFFEPLQELSAAWHDRASGQAAIEALNLLSLPGTPLLNSKNGKTIHSHHLPSPPSIKISEMTFGHAGAIRPVFQNFSLVIKPGEKIALLGPSGAGKSTLLSLIVGLAPVCSGSIIIDSRSMSDDTAAQLRERMAWIGQKPHLFSGTLRSNVALGRDHVGPEAISSALRFAALDDFARNNHGPIGEGGSGLSGGEALRLALARAAADIHTDIILADEPTSHLDKETAREVEKGIFALAKNKTLVIATHDEALAARMDRIVRLETQV